MKINSPVSPCILFVLLMLVASFPAFPDALVSVDPRPISGEPGFIALCTWNVSASVGHWGHIHQRQNQYQAELTVKPVDGMWKITDLELIQEERL